MKRGGIILVYHSLYFSFPWPFHSEAPPHLQEKMLLLQAEVADSTDFIIIPHGEDFRILGF